MEIQRTRQSIGSQVREALDLEVERGSLSSWHLYTHKDGRLMYGVRNAHHPNGHFDGPAGMVMDYLNALGYDIRFGKS